VTLIPERKKKVGWETKGEGIKSEVLKNSLWWAWWSLHLRSQSTIVSSSQSALLTIPCLKKNTKNHFLICTFVYISEDMTDLMVLQKLWKWREYVNTVKIDLFS
jgi:hypothetical protein